MNSNQSGQGRPDSVTGGSRTPFRIVIGVYGAASEAALVADDLRKAGLDRQQTCLIMTGGKSAETVACARRHMAGLVLDVSAEALFDRLWPQGTAEIGAAASWMTETQSSLLVEHLRRGGVLLVASAGSEQEQIIASRIQLKHHPVIMQAYNFTF
jgi:hypothetical protein